MSVCVCVLDWVCVGRSGVCPGVGSVCGVPRHRKAAPLQHTHTVNKRASNPSTHPPKNALILLPNIYVDIVCVVVSCRLAVPGVMMYVWSQQPDLLPIFPLLEGFFTFQLATLLQGLVEYEDDKLLEDYDRNAFLPGVMTLGGRLGSGQRE